MEERAYCYGGVNKQMKPPKTNWAGDASTAQLVFGCFICLFKTRSRGFESRLEQENGNSFLVCFMLYHELRVFPRIISDDSFMGQNYIWYSTKRWEKTEVCRLRRMGVSSCETHNSNWDLILISNWTRIRQFLTHLPLKELSLNQCLFLHSFSSHRYS